MKSFEQCEVNYVMGKKKTIKKYFMHICVIMRTFQINHTSLASCLFITYICIVFSFIIYVFVTCYDTHCSLYPLFSPYRKVTSNSLCLSFRWNVEAWSGLQQVAEDKKKKEQPQSSELAPMLRNCHQCHYIGLSLYASGNHMCPLCVMVWLWLLDPLGHCFQNLKKHCFKALSGRI